MWDCLSISQRLGVMRVQLEKASFLRALSHQQSVVERKTAIPILTHLLLEATFDGRIKLMGTDLELTVVERVPATVHEEGAIALSAHLLYDIVRKLKEGELIDLVFATQASTVLLRSGRSQFTLQVLSVAEFPLMTHHQPTHNFALTGDELRRLIDQTRFAMSTEEARYALNGVYFHADEGNLRAVATDAHRLALSWLPLPPQSEGLEGIILSRKTISEVRKLIDGKESLVEISVSPTQMAFKVGDVTLYARLIKGNFPDYKRAIPQGNNQIIEVDKRFFAEAVDRVSMLSPDKTHAIRLCFQEGSLTFSAQSAENGSASEEVPVTYSGEPMELGFNARYVLDVMQQIRGDSFHMHVSDPAIPAIITDTKDENSLYVLMPMRI